MARRVALRLLLATGLASGTRAWTAPALALDDTCEAPGAAHCALSALQRSRAARQAQPATLLLGTPDLCSLNTPMLTHHKSGTVMAMEAAKALNEALANEAGCPDALYGELFGAYTMAGMIATGYNVTKEASSRCFLHLERDPFELIVSAYRYHLSPAAAAMDGGEPWLNVTSKYCDKDASGGRSSLAAYCRENPAADCQWLYALWAPPFVEAVCEAWSSGLLPAPGVDEGFQAFLKRMDVDTGLLANALLLSAPGFEFDQLEDLHDIALASNCSANACLPEFESACNATWHRALAMATRVPEPELTMLTQAAASSCPEYATASVEAHSGQQPDLEAGGQELPSTVELMQRMRELDLRYLNGTVAALARKISCPGDPAYH